MLAALPAKRRRKLLHTDFAIRWHHDAHRLAIDLRHRRLQQAPRFNAKRLGGLQADAVGARIVVVSVQFELDAQFGERQRRAGGLGHIALAPWSRFAAV